MALTASGKTQVLERTGGGSYLSASDGRLHFGLGKAEKVDRIAVKWARDVLMSTRTCGPIRAIC